MPHPRFGEYVDAELTRRFGLPLWSFTLSSTDANRWAIRLARLVTSRSKIVCFSYSYHGSVDETFVIAGLGTYLHLAMCNRGILMTPSKHGSDVSRQHHRRRPRHSEIFREVVSALVR